MLSAEEREIIFKNFYKIQTKNLQDSHLCGLISVVSVKNRRSRKQKQVLVQYSDSDEDNTAPNYEHAAHYKYKVRTKHRNSNSYKEVQVCRKAFLSLHGITPAHLRRLQSNLCTFLKAPVDKRGQHKNRPNSTPTEVENLVQDHIKSFKPRQSHYSLRQNPNRYYLPETMSVRKLYRLFLEEYRLQVSYKVYWNIFQSKFNIKFGLPRTDTCTICDTFIQKIAAVENDEAKAVLEAEKQLHLRKAQAFYDLKKNWKVRAKGGQAMVVCFDYMQNLPLPHVRDNLAFRCRQLWYYVFGVHNLADDSASMYVYDECTARKGQNEVTSLLFHYFTKVVDITSRNLVLLSDGCPGQNKNYVMMHFLYMLVHCLKLFDRITYIFPIRGHSFLPNDQDFSVISKRKAVETAEIPEHWDTIIETCRQKPSPFNVVKVQQKDIFNFKLSTQKFFTKNPRPPVQLKSLRMYRIQQCNKFLEVRDSYSGPWRQSIIRNKTPLTNTIELYPMYERPIPINPLKLNDLKTLCGVLSCQENRTFYDSLGANAEANADLGDVDEEDNSSAYED